MHCWLNGGWRRAVPFRRGHAFRIASRLLPRSAQRELAHPLPHLHYTTACTLLHHHTRLHFATAYAFTALPRPTYLLRATRFHHPATTHPPALFCEDNSAMKIARAYRCRKRRTPA